jgi:predicted aspartyl protease
MKPLFRSALTTALALVSGAIASTAWCGPGWPAALDETAVTIPMHRNSHDMYTVDVTVGRSLLFSGNPQADPVPFIVDTGANRTAVPRLIAHQLIADEQISFDQIGHSVTGPFDTGLFFVDQLDFGAGPREVEVAVFEEHYGSVLSAAGILGANAFRDEVVVLDYPAQELRFVPPTALPAGDMPLRIENGLLVGEGRIRGLEGPVRVLVDTGANASVVNTALVRNRWTSGSGQSAQIEGVSGGGVSTGDTRRIFGGFQISDLCASAFTITVSDLYFFDRIGWSEEPAIILGMDALQHARITIDYGNATARIDATGNWTCDARN